jgi:hypothetical protein
VDRRAFVRSWTRIEGYVAYVPPLPAPILPRHESFFTIRPNTIVPLFGLVYSFRSVRLGA